MRTSKPRTLVILDEAAIHPFEPVPSFDSWMWGRVDQSKMPGTWFHEPQDCFYYADIGDEQFIQWTYSDVIPGEPEVCADEWSINFTIKHLMGPYIIWWRIVC